MYGRAVTTARTSPVMSGIFQSAKAKVERLPFPLGGAGVGTPANGRAFTSMPLPAPQSSEAQPQDCPQRSPDFALRHLRGSRNAVLEADGRLDDPIAQPPGPVHHLDLEGVTLRHDLVQLDI